MTTSQTSFLSEVLEGLAGKEIPQSRLAYFRARLRNRIYNLVVGEFKRQQGKKADLARRIGRDPAQVTRWLSSPSNWTLDTISDLMVAMGTEPELSIALLSERTAEKKPMVSPELQLPRPVIKVKLAPFITGSFRQWSEQNAQTAPTSTMSVPPHHIGPQQLFEIAASL